MFVCLLTSHVRLYLVLICDAGVAAPDAAADTAAPWPDDADADSISLILLL